jgi:hypothetical protein
MGYNIGLRLIEDFLARTNTGRCGNFRETAETIAKVMIPLLGKERSVVDRGGTNDSIGAAR